MTRHWKLILIFLLIFCIGLFFWRKSTTKVNEVINVVQVKKDKLVKKLNVSGVVDAKQKAVLHFAVGGKIVSLGAKEGDSVKKWQSLAKIDSSDLQKRMSQDLNLYFNQRLDFEQNKNDRQDLAPTDKLGRLSQKDQKILENSVLDVEIQNIAIRNTVLSSPIQGVLVTAPTAIPGVNLGPTDNFEVVDPKSLVFKAAVDETDIAQIKKGQTATIKLDAYPDQNITATISAIAYRSAQTSKGTVFVVELPIGNDTQSSLLDRYRLGMNGDTDITLAEKDDVLQIPVSTLIERDGKKFVKKKIAEHMSVEVEITTGLETDEMIEVLSGLKEGDEVVVP